VSAGSRLIGGAIAAAFFCVQGAAFAQQQQPVPPPPEKPPGAVPTPEQLAPKLPFAKPGTPLPEATPAAKLRELGKPSDELTIDVVAYTVDDDAPAALRQALPKITAPYVGKGKTYEDLVNATGAVTRFLQRELGFYLGYAFLPEQDAKGGVIRIAVLEGRLDQVILNWPDKMPVRREVVEAYLARLKPGEVLRVRDVERVVFLVNDLRGITARFEVKSGRVPGTASLVVTPTPEDRIASRIEVDTLGSRYSGTVRVGALATISSPTGSGDGLVVNALSSTNAGLQFALVGYTLPVGSDGLKIGASVSGVKYKLGEELADTKLKGTASTFTAYGLYPVVRSRNLNVFGLASIDVKDFTDEAQGIPKKKKITDLQLSVSGDVRDDYLTGGVNTYELVLLHGKLDRPGQVGITDNPPNYTFVRLNLTRLQNLIENRLLLYAALRSQLAMNNLDSVEQFQVGGPDRVRAFAPGEGTGDEGLVMTLELRLLPPESWFGSYGRIAREVVFSAFIDMGTVKARHDATLAQAEAIRLDPTQPFVNTSTFSGWGVGAIWDRPRNFALRAYLSWPISGDPKNDPVVKKPRLYLTATKSF
jgi:hemolysin activation/secretion protein